MLGFAVTFPLVGVDTLNVTDTVCVSVPAVMLMSALYVPTADMVAGFTVTVIT